MSTSKRPTPDAPAGDSVSTPAKRLKTEGDASGAAVPKVSNNDDVSSPAVTRDTDSPSARGNRGRGGRGGDRGGRGRGGDKRGGRGDRRGGRGGGDSRSWGGRSDNAKGGMREWGKKEGAEGEEGEGEDKKERLPKKKVAVLVGYNGLGYSGSQINPGVDTIEGDVFKAFVMAGAISEDNSTSPQKVGLARAARTDAGVHAAVNVISLKLILSPPNLPADISLETYINSFLPPTIRLWSFIRVQGSFNPRTLCDQRHYEYTIPTHMFLGPKPGTPMDTWIQKSRSTTFTPSAAIAPVAQAASGSPLIEEVKLPAAPTALETSAAAAIAESDKFWSAQPEGSAFAEDLVAKRAWRISEGLLASIQAFFTAYEGSHNYYNYTVAKDFRDRSCQRVMKKLDVSAPFVVNGTEFISVSFLGQSFMLHQIRKMIGLAILAIRTSTPPSLVAETFGPSRIHVPKAPGLGLLLLEPQYLEYNKRVDESNKKLVVLEKEGRIKEQEVGEQTRDPVEIGALLDKVDAFKKEEIYKKMWEVEEKDAVFSQWLNYLDVYVGPDFEYLNSKGIIPQTAVFKKGENPEKTRLPAGAPVVEGEAPKEEAEEVVVEGEEEG